MFSKENSDFSLPSHFKKPYSRPTTSRIDSTVSKIMKRPRTSENNYGRSPIAAKPFGFRNSNPDVTQNFNEPSTSYSGEIMDDVIGITVTSYSKSVRNRSEFETVHFRPRKSQLRDRSFDNNSDHSLELKMMTIDDTQETSENSKSFKSKNSHETPGKGFQIKARQNLLRIFTGSVENLLHWSRLRTSLHILFEVTANVDCVQQGKWKSEKIFCLSDSKSGPKLQVVYHEIDRPLPNLVINSLVTCIGRLVARNRLQAYKVEECSEDKKNDLQRLSFICNRVADELVNANQKK